MGLSGTAHQHIRARLGLNLRIRRDKVLGQRLEWATASETGYTATYQLWGRTNAVNQYLSVPDSRVVQAFSGLSVMMWRWAK